MRRFAPAQLLAVVLLAGCGSVPPAMGSDVSALPTASSPMPSPSDSTADWQVFSSPQLGYTIKYPSTLRYQGSTAGDYPSDNFSNENVAGPAEMDQSGLFVAIVVTSHARDQCLLHNLRGATIDRDDSVVVDGNQASLNVFTFTSPALPMMVLNIVHGGHCYQFDFIALNPPVRNAYESTAQLMLGTFRFGPGPRPTT